MGIQAVKGVEIGDGFALARERGSEAHDEIEPGLKRRTNRAGGIEAGISNGEELVVRAAMKPLPTLMRPLDSVDLATGEPAQALVERSDVAAVEALAVVAEAAVAWELARAAREKFGGDALGDFVAAHARVPRAHPGAETHAARPSRRARSASWARARPRSGPQLAEQLGRPFVDVDGEIEREEPIARIFETGGEAAFRLRESKHALEALGSAQPAVIALGGGAVGTDQIREGAARSGPHGPGRDRRRGGMAARRGQRPAARAGRSGVPDAVRRAAAALRRCRGRAGRGSRRRRARRGGVHVEPGALERLGELVPARARSSSSATRGWRGSTAWTSSSRSARAPVPSTSSRPGSRRRRSSRSRRSGARSGSSVAGTLVALGGGCTTDVAGFAAATYFRGIDWVAVPTTLVGQVDAAIGGKTAIDLPEGKNLVGAFHWPVRTVIDPVTLETLPEEEAANGLAEVVKTGLLAGEPIWELPLGEQVRRAAAFKTALCLRDPHDRGERAQLNLGHTFAHALEAAADYALPHGRAVALGLLAALRLSGLDTKVVEETLRPEPVRVDRDAAWAALARDKKVVDGTPRLVLLEAPGRPRVGVEVPSADVRAALDELIAG